MRQLEFPPEAIPLHRKLLLIGLHFLPGLIFSAILFPLMPFIAQTQVDIFLIQAFFVFVFLLGMELAIAQIYCRFLEGQNLRDSLRKVGATAFSYRVFFYAMAWGVVSAIIMKVYVQVASAPIDWFRKLPLFSLPDWHYQNLDMPSYHPAVKMGLLACMLGFNVFAEEVYFRGFLLERLKFLGKSAFLVNGVLFILYHIFQARVSYPLIPFGILVSGYYVVFRNIWGAMLIHLILNIALSF